MVTDVSAGTLAVTDSSASPLDVAAVAIEGVSAVAVTAPAETMVDRLDVVWVGLG
jgi:hypothetical protein